MTYCLALRLDAGLLFLSDTRTNAGVDNIGTYRKLHVIRPAPDRVLVLQAAGSLATTHEVLARIDRDLVTEGSHESLATVEHLFEAALYVGRLSREIAAAHRAALNAVGADGTATFILGGQIAGDRPDIFLVYSEGNYIRTSDTVPFLQIGERKYGKFLLELAVRAHVDLQTAARSPSVRCSARRTPTCRSGRRTTSPCTATARSRSTRCASKPTTPTSPSWTGCGRNGCSTASSTCRRSRRRCCRASRRSRERYGSPIDAPEPDPEVVAHYDAFPEEGRITEGLGQLELLRTQEVVRRHLPAGPSRILDVGGGTGVHAAWLAGDGHHVHLIDPVPRQVDVARQLPAARAGVLTAEVGEARHLPHDDSSFDVVLLLGPLYHLVDEADRLRTLGEARRVLRPGGLLFAAVVSRYASLFDGLARGYLFDREFREIVERDLTDGVHHNPRRRREWFTTAYFHRPGDLAAEVAAADLWLREMVGLEGLAPWIPGLVGRWDDPGDREVIVAAARLIESESALLGLSPHLLAVAERPA